MRLLLPVALLLFATRKRLAGLFGNQTNTMAHLAANLTDWSESVVAFEDMLATRREAYSTRLPRIEAALDDVDIDAIDAQRDRVITERRVLGKVVLTF